MVRYLPVYEPGDTVRIVKADGGAPVGSEVEVTYVNHNVKEPFLRYQWNGIDNWHATFDEVEPGTFKLHLPPTTGPTAIPNTVSIDTIDIPIVVPEPAPVSVVEPEPAPRQPEPMNSEEFLAYLDRDSEEDQLVTYDEKVEKPTTVIPPEPEKGYTQSDWEWDQAAESDEATEQENTEDEPEEHIKLHGTTVMSVVEQLDYLTGNAVDNLLRKDADSSHLKAAIWYIERKLKNLRK